MIRIFLLLVSSAALATGQSEPCLADAMLDVSESPGAGPPYPRPRVEASCEGNDLVVRSNGIPHYEFVQVTPNPLKEQDYEFRVPAQPRRADAPIPIPLLGGIGFAVNGVVIFGPNEGPVPPEEQFGDPVFNAIMDTCMGHTALEYHYHAMVQKCLSQGIKEGDPSPVLGFGFDGFPIRGPWGCADAECSEVIRYRSSWEEVREPHQDAWDAYEYVQKHGREYLDACNGAHRAGGRLPLSRDRDVAIHPRLLRWPAGRATAPGAARSASERGGSRSARAARRTCPRHQSDSKSGPPPWRAGRGPRSAQPRGSGGRRAGAGRGRGDCRQSSQGRARRRKANQSRGIRTNFGSGARRTDRGTRTHAST